MIISYNKQKVMGKKMLDSSQADYLKIDTKCIGRVYRLDNMADQVSMKIK